MDEALPIARQIAEALEAASRDSTSFPVFPPEKAEFSSRANTTLNVPSFALSPDGHALVFGAQMPGVKPTLWVRSLVTWTRARSPERREPNPFWSPDGQWIGFFADGMLKKVPAAGGAVQVIKQKANDFRGATWGARDTILLATEQGSVASEGLTGPVATPRTRGESRDARVRGCRYSLQENTHRIENPIVFARDGAHASAVSGLATRPEQSLRGLTASETRSALLARVRAITRISGCLPIRHVSRRRWSIRRPVPSSSGSPISSAGANPVLVPAAA